MGRKKIVKVRCFAGFGCMQGESEGGGNKRVRWAWFWACNCHIEEPVESRPISLLQTTPASGAPGKLL